MLNVLETLIAQDLAEVLVNDSAVPHRIAIEHLEGFAKAKNLVQRFGEGREVERAMVRSRIVERELLAQNRPEEMLDSAPEPMLSTTPAAEAG